MGIYTFGGSGSAATGGGLIKVKPNIVFGKAGGRVIRTGDSIGLGNGGGQYSLFDRLITAVKSRLKSANLSPPTFTTNRAVGGNTMHDIWVTGLAQLITDLSSDGNEIWANGIINDVLQLAGNDTTGPWSIGAAVGFLEAAITSILGTFPNTRFLIFGPMTCNGEKWALDPATGKPIGSGNSTTDATVRAADQALASACAAFPNNVRYVSVQDAFWAQAALINPTNTTPGFMSQDGLHPSMIALGTCTDRALASALFAEYRIPGTVVAPSRYDFSSGDWFDEGRTFLQRHLTGGSGSLVNPGTFNRFVPVYPNPAHINGTTITDPGIAGGAVKYAAPASLTMLTTAFLPTPKASPFAYMIQGSFTAIAASMTAQMGLSNSGGSEEFLVGIDQAVAGGGATNWVRYETHSGTTTKTASSVAADTNSHTWYFVHQPSESSTDILDVYCDQTQVFHINPGANFPQAACGLAVSHLTNSGAFTFQRGGYLFNE